MVPANTMNLRCVLVHVSPKPNPNLVAGDSNPTTIVHRQGDLLPKGTALVAHTIRHPRWPIAACHFSSAVQTGHGIGA